MKRQNADLAGKLNNTEKTCASLEQQTSSTIENLKRNVILKPILAGFN
jgi:hypothetical protein